MNKIPKEKTGKLTEKKSKINLKNAFWAVGLFVLWIFLVPRIESWIGVENINRVLDEAGIFSPLIFIIARIIAIIVSPLNLGPVGIILHRAFGFWPSVLYSSISIILGCTINYWLGKIFGKRVAKWFLNEDETALLEKYGEKYLNKNLFTSTLILYAANYELVSYAAGLTKLPFWKFLISVILAVIVRVPLDVTQDLLIGKNSLLAFIINISTISSSTLIIYLITKEDLKKIIQSGKRSLITGKKKSEEE
jgi:uncharacterized membrane protein YdjX (TVP38/TMEM64 family)